MSGYTNSAATGRDLGQRETASLIGASKVSGTGVYSRIGESLGSIYDVMLDKRSGQVSYAVLSFGGFLGMGEKYHPLPWNKLTYSEDLGGYVVDIDRSLLEGAPSYTDADAADWSGAYGRNVDRYYGGLPTVI